MFEDELDLDYAVMDAVEARSKTGGHTVKRFKFQSFSDTFSKNKFRTILRRFRDRSDDRELLIPLGVRLSELSNFKFRIAADTLQTFI